jgi:hypothetical protein
MLIANPLGYQPHRHRRTEYEVDVVKKVEPARPETDTRAALADPIGMANGEATHHGSGIALVIRRECLGSGVHLLDRLGRHVGK